MSKSNLIFIFCLFIFTSCSNSKKSELELVSNETLKSWVSSGNFPKAANITILDENGKRVNSESMISIENPREVARDYFINNHGEVVQIRLRNATEKDKLLFDELTKLENKNKKDIDFSSINFHDVKCADKKKLLEEILRKDQLNRINGVEEINRDVDKINLEILNSLITKCGNNFLDNLNKKHGTAIFLTVQHSTKVWRKHFQTFINDVDKKGLLATDQMALFQDRILMDENKPQIYGTQFQNGEMYKVDNIDSVKLRRQRLGMVTLEDYQEILN